MKSIRLVAIFLGVVMAAWAVKSWAGTLTMNTYYPAPTGYYETLTVRTKLLIPCYTSAPSGQPVNAIYVVGTGPNCIAP